MADGYLLSSPILAVGFVTWEHYKGAFSGGSEAIVMVTAWLIVDTYGLLLS